MTDVRLRFAPSPTGYLHIGGLRTALYNYLYAKQNGGDFLLRIEDTDRTRFVEGAIENLLEALQWAGLHVDEGVKMTDGRIVQAGAHAPYIQSERVSMRIYDDIADKLLEEGHAYPCFCTKERLDTLRAQQKADGKVPRYDGLCRGISPEDAKARIEAGEEYVLRMKLPAKTHIVFDDLIRGHMDIATEDMDDQVLIKSDGFPTYHLAVVVDDHAMGITHVVRGEEWLPSTPKHVLLYDMLGWEKPVFVHLPTVLNKDHKKLSKRNDDVAVEDFRAQGYLPEGLINYLALVGWSPEDNQEIFTMDELIEAFDFTRVSSSGGIFDRDKLNWVNAQHIKQKSDEELAALLQPYLKEAGRIDDETDPAWLMLLAATFKENLHTLQDIVEESAMVFADTVDTVEPEAEEYLQSEQAPVLAKAMHEAIGSVEDFAEEAKTLMKRVQKETGIKGKPLFMTMRSLLTGSVHGPDLNQLLLLLGPDKLQRRLQAYL
ncbi:MAG: glutamate--tRNA ligase [Tissierellia bacterium]|jgi:nondiscriminating glutamyl-tRNA synthetase|nr:glutamate--tRNA ligase [Bacillota bacterium]NLK59162.1 glutamate--tRNA ligase [Tissierellia bacterium]